MTRRHTDSSYIDKLFQKRTLSPKTQKIIKIMVGFLWGGCLFFLFWKGWQSRDQIIVLFQRAEYVQLFGSMFFYLANLIAAMIGWLAIIRTFEGVPNWWKNLQIFSATFAVRRLPGTLWYIGGRLVMYQRLGVSKSVVLRASAIELVAAFGTAGVVGIGLLLGTGEKFPIALSSAVVLFAIGALILAHPWVFKRVLRPDDQINLTHARKSDWMIWIVSFSVMWVLGGMMVVQMVKVFQPFLGAHEILYLIGAWALSGMAGLSTIFLPSSFGATELSLTVLLTKLLPLPVAGTIALATRIFTMLMEVILSAAFYPIVIRYYNNLQGEEGDKKTGDPTLGG